MKGVIRPLVICLFSNNGKILVARGFDRVKNEWFYRPLGGQIEFGEYSQEALIREIREEVQQEIHNVRYLGLIENLFTFSGIDEHEIVLVYDADFVNRYIYTRDVLSGIEDNLEDPVFQAIWRSLDELSRRDSLPLYPTGLLDLVNHMIKEESS